MSRIAIFRLVALVLLLLTSAELFACEILSPDNCETLGFPNDGNQSSPDDGCLCCCAHVVIVIPVTLTPRTEQVSTAVMIERVKPTTQSSSIYHPPRV